MSYKTLPIHGTPDKQVYGLVGQIIESDNGFAYTKYDNDTLNLKWYKVLTPAPITPTPTPTPTP
jgi:hypothetical protein